MLFPQFFMFERQFMSDQTPDWLKYDEDAGIVTITLARPFAVGGDKQTELAMREPTVLDQKIASKAGTTGADHEVRLFANLLEITEAELGAMRMKDYSRVQQAYRLFTN